MIRPNPCSMMLNRKLEFNEISKYCTFAHKTIIYTLKNMRKNHKLRILIFSLQLQAYYKFICHTIKFIISLTTVVTLTTPATILTESCHVSSILNDALTRQLTVAVCAHCHWAASIAVHNYPLLACNHIKLLNSIFRDIQCVS